MWLGFWLVEAALPSPKLQLKVNGAVPPEGSAVRLTFTGASPAGGFAAAVSAGRALTTTCTVAVFLTALASVTVSVAVYVPAALYA